MHSRIFALRYVSKDMPTDYEMLNENVDFDRFMSYADYVANSDNYDEDLHWLEECYTGIFSIEKKDNDRFVHVNRKGLETYFKGRFDQLKIRLDKYNLEEFMSLWGNTYDIKNLLCGDDFGFHFGTMGNNDTIHDTWYDNQMEFFRLVYSHMKRENLDEIVFRFEGSLDYHS